MCLVCETGAEEKLNKHIIASPVETLHLPAFRNRTFSPHTGHAMGNWVHGICGRHRAVVLVGRRVSAERAVCVRDHEEPRTSAFMILARAEAGTRAFAPSFYSHLAECASSPPELSHT